MNRDKAYIGDKLIAEFMGYTEGTDTYYGKMTDEKGSNIFPCLVAPDGEKITNVYYHSSWDWLMPVVEKITNIYNQADFEMALELKECPSMIWELKLCGPSIENIWEESIKFITWHNNQNKQS